MTCGNHSTATLRLLLLAAVVAGYLLVNVSVRDEAVVVQKKHKTTITRAAGPLNIQLYPPPPRAKSIRIPVESNRTVTIIPSEFRVARLVNPSPQLGQPSVQEYEGHALPPRYTCAGPAYDKFIQKAAQMVQQRLQSSEEIDLWGRRSTLVPPQTSPKILILGNSHTRQVVLSLEWQYQDHIISYGLSEDEHALGLAFRTNDSLSEKNGVATVHLLYNHPAVYSARWQQNIEEVIGCPINQLDAIVLGAINQYQPQFKGTLMWSHMTTYAKEYPEQQINLNHYPKGFGLQDLIHVYKGPIISLSSFARKQHLAYRQNLEIARRETPSRTNIRLINARAPIYAIGEHDNGECGHEGRGGLVTDCNPNASEQHRCMGAKGGIPDFAAWDLVEALYDVLG